MGGKRTAKMIAVYVSEQEFLLATKYAAAKKIPLSKLLRDYLKTLRLEDHQ